MTSLEEYYYKENKQLSYKLDATRFWAAMIIIGLLISLSAALR